MTLLDDKLRTIIIAHDAPLHLMDGFQLPNILLPRPIMNLRDLTRFAGLGAILLASCHPYNEHPGRQPTRPPVQKTVTSPEQQKVREDRDRMKQEEAKNKEEMKGSAAETGTTTQTSEATPKPQIEEKHADYAVANKVPGKDGFVFSPYNNKVVDVRDIPKGTLVQDPTYTGAGKGYFRVP